MNQMSDAFMGAIGFKRVKPLRCKSCRQLFTPTKPLQTVCGPKCAHELVMANKAKMQRKEDRERKSKLKTRSDYMKEAQAAVNAYVRARDEGFPCISCGIDNPKQWHAGHYLSRGAHPELALEPRNIFKQCSQCNDYLSGNQIEMRKGIIARKGVEEIEWLEGPHDPKKYSIDDLKAIKDEYKLKLKQLKQERNA